MDDLGSDEEEGAAGAPLWMATFADLMSLLLAFFVLLFSFSNTDEQLYNEVGGSMKDAFGVQSDVVLTDPVKGMNHIAQEFSSGRPDPKIINVVPQENLDLRMLWNSDQLKSGKSEEENQEDKLAQKQKPTSDEKEKAKQSSKAQAKEKAAKTQEKLSGQMVGNARGMTADNKASVSSEALNKVASFASKKAQKLGKELASEIANGQVTVETEGNKVIVRVSEEASFPPGSADSYSQFNDVVDKIAGVVKESPGNVVVEGHTDNIPISSTKFRSNWDLSASRAASVVHGLINGTGLPTDRFEVRGHAGTKPLKSNRTAKGRSVNRRVEVIIEYDEKNLIPPSLKKDIVKTDEEKKEKVKVEKDALDPLLDLYRGFNNSLKESAIDLSESEPIEAEDTNLIFDDNFFR